MYATELYTTTGFDAVQTKLFSPTITVRRWSSRINAPGVFYFSIPKFHVKATEANLRHKRRIRLFRQNHSTEKYEAVWSGFVQDWRDVGPNREILCYGMLAALEDRLASHNQQFDGEGGTEVSSLLSAVNSAGQTGISMGTTDVTTTRDVQMSGRASVSSVLQKLAQAHGAEYDVNVDAELNFVEALGEDKTSTIHVVYRDDGQRGMNVTDIQLAYEGGIVNMVYGVSSAGEGLTTTQSDAPSIETYGLLEKEIAFNEAQDQTTLDSMAAAWLSQHKQPIPDLKIEPEYQHRVPHPVTGALTMKGLDYTSFGLGDLVSVTIITPNETAENVVKRIAEIDVNVDDNGNERILLTLTEAGVYVTSRYLDVIEQRDMRRRLAALEAMA